MTRLPIPGSQLLARHYLDDAKRVIRVFIPWRGETRRRGVDRRAADRRATLRFALDRLDRRDRIDRRQIVRDHDGYRIAKHGAAS